MPDLAILGGGISGLAAAYRLQQQGHAVTLYEATPRTGGAIRSERADGFLVEHGPNALQPTVPELEALVEELGLAAERVEAGESARHRFVVRGGNLVAVPTSPPAFFKSPLLSTKAKLRLLREPFIAPSPGEESVAAWTRRRLGEEALRYGVEPFVTGVYAGDAEALSLRHTFPRLAKLEAEHGSLIRGMIRQQQARKQSNEPRMPRRPLYSFRDGLETLPRRLTERLGEAVCTGTPVTGLHPDDAGWRVTTAASSARFDAVILTLPLHRLPALDSPLDFGPLPAVHYPPLSVLALGFRRTDVAHPLDGFGVLVPKVEQRNVLGIIFNSSLFPNRAPEGHVLLTVFAGGRRQPDIARLETSELRQPVLADLEALLGVKGNPVFERHVFWPHAIPQYDLGYGAVLETLDALEANHPGLYFAGNYRHGVSVGDTVRGGLLAADRAGRKERET